MKNIKSKQNEKIKYLKKLQQKKYREEFEQFSVENLTIINDAFKNRIIPEKLFLSTKMIEKNNVELEKLLKKVLNIYFIDESINKSFSSLTNPSGICAVYNKINQKINYSQKIIYLNKIKDPGNLGTILRTALAFGYENIVIDEKSVDLYNPKVISAAKDAIFKLNIEIDKNLKIFQKIKSKMKVYVTNLEKGKNLSEINFEKSKYCIVFGNETNGVDDKIIQNGDDFIKIKIKKIESLNVAVTAGIIMHFY